MHLRDSYLIKPADRIFIAGSKGMAGSAIYRALKIAGYGNAEFAGCLFTPSRKDLNLKNKLKVNQYFSDSRPTVVIMAAAKVGGILANDSYPVDFLLDNLTIQSNIIEASWRYGVRRLLYLGSSCMYPKFAKQPIREDSLLTGKVEPTNEWYALAKIAGLKLCEAMYRQYGLDYISLVPTNLYGPGDNYDRENSHVMGAMLRRFLEAKENKTPSVKCWGTGSPIREFLHADDLGSACVFALQHWKPNSNELRFLNVGSGESLTIRELAQKVSEAVKYRGVIEWDETKKDGAPIKILDSSLFNALGWKPSFNLNKGLQSLVMKELSQYKFP
tara:strand:+ start:5799 stop:6788 length:990 start_codon:yes stop_codon:yes gene_type:complete